MKEECLICGAPLEYLETDVQMQCEICRKKELAKTRCISPLSSGGWRCRAAICTGRSTM